MNRTLVAAVAATFATFASFAATSGVQAATTAIEFGDLDLATAQGQAKLDSRINRAVRGVCSEATTGSHIAMVDKDCVAKARASVEKQVAARRAASRNGG
jgi:UrcA family protein